MVVGQRACCEDSECVGRRGLQRREEGTVGKRETSEKQRGGESMRAQRAVPSQRVSNDAVSRTDSISRSTGCTRVYSEVRHAFQGSWFGNIK